jgi:hypothetical protein
MLLADELTERSRPHPCRERRICGRPLARALRLLSVAKKSLRPYLRLRGAFVGAGEASGAGAVCTGARIWNGSPAFPVAVTV